MKRLVIFMIAALVWGCAVQKAFVADGGSRSDGTVKLSIFYSEFEQPVYSMSQGLSLAKSKCAAWGYANAEAFGTIRKRCQNHQCTSTVEFQCLDASTSASSKASK